MIACAAAWRRRGEYVPGQTQPTGRLNTSTASTVSSLATPPFPGRHAAGGMSASSDASERDADGERRRERRSVVGPVGGRR